MIQRHGDSQRIDCPAVRDQRRREQIGQATVKARRRNHRCAGLPRRFVETLECVQRTGLLGRDIQIVSPRP